MLDYTVMRIYQRTSENTAISYSVWVAIIVVALGVGLVQNAWPVALLIALAVGFFKWLENHDQQDARKLEALRARERFDSDRSDLQRLQDKYRA